jgi:hypothetical protein
MMPWGLHDGRGKMRKFWFGLAFAAMLISPASAQDYHRNWVECAKELGWQLDHSQKLGDGRTLTMWRWQNEAQQATFNDCVARKASVASKPSGNVRQRTSR